MICLIKHRSYGESTTLFFPNYKEAMAELMADRGSTVTYELYEVDAEHAVKVYPPDKEATP